MEEKKNNYKEKTLWIALTLVLTLALLISIGYAWLTLTKTSEKVNTIKAGTLKLVGTDENNIYEATKELLLFKDCYDAMSNAVNPYGDGHASERIVSIIQDNLSKRG